MADSAIPIIEWTRHSTAWTYGVCLGAVAFDQIFSAQEQVSALNDVAGKVAAIAGLVVTAVTREYILRCTDPPPEEKGRCWTALETLLKSTEWTSGTAPDFFLDGIPKEKLHERPSIYQVAEKTLLLGMGGIMASACCVGIASVSKAIPLAAAFIGLEMHRAVQRARVKIAEMEN